MKPKELRIGNLVNWEGQVEKYLWYIDAMDIHKMDNDLDYCDSLKPIPLTLQWLNRLHDYIKIYENEVVIDRFHLIQNTNFNFWTVFDSETLVYITKVEFVHEWQNVYFYLNSTELTWTE